MSIVGLFVQVIQFLVTCRVPYNLAIFGPSTTRKCRQRYRRLKIRVGAARRAAGHDRCPWRADVPRRRLGRWLGRSVFVVALRRHAARCNPSPVCHVPTSPSERLATCQVVPLCATHAHASCLSSSTSTYLDVFRVNLINLVQYITPQTVNIIRMMRHPSTVAS